MGQQLSRNLAASFERGLERARSQMDKQMREEAMRSSHDPNAAAGFTRGATETSQEAIQRQFLELKNPRGPTEMPQDLIKFLNDVGPLRRTVDRDLSSPRLRESLQPLHNDKDTPGLSSQDPRRQLRPMPLKGTQMDHVTTRTTNFSDLPGPKESFGLNELHFYELLAQLRTKDELWDEIKRHNEADQAANDVSQERHSKFELMERTQRYLEIPIILKDVKNKEYLGVSLTISSEQASATNNQGSGSSDVVKHGIRSSTFNTLQPATGVKMVLQQILDRQTTSDE